LLEIFVPVQNLRKIEIVGLDLGYFVWLRRTGYRLNPTGNFM
jgi:hypothetical protein